MRKIYKCRSNDKGTVTAEHILIAEKALGRKLPAGAVVHHVDEDWRNNTPSNLVVCPDRAYHNLLHRRMRALAECGHADWRKCGYCKQYDDPAVMVEQKRYGRNDNGTMIHAECKKKYMRNYLKTYRKD